MCVCMYACMWICTHVDLCIYSCVIVCMYATMYVFMYAYMFLCNYVRIYVWMYECVCTCAGRRRQAGKRHACPYACVHVYIKNVTMYASVYSCIIYIMLKCLCLSVYLRINFEHTLNMTI